MLVSLSISACCSLGDIFCNLATIASNGSMSAIGRLNVSLCVDLSTSVDHFLRLAFCQVMTLVLSMASAMSLTVVPLGTVSSILKVLDSSLSASGDNEHHLDTIRSCASIMLNPLESNLAKLSKNDVHANIKS